jgi:hypothetical protein
MGLIGTSLVESHHARVGKSGRGFALTLCPFPSQIKRNRLDRNVTAKLAIYGSPDRSERSGSNCLNEFIPVKDQ